MITYCNKMKRIRHVEDEKQLATSPQPQPQQNHRDRLDSIKKEYAKYILLESPPNKVLMCSGFVITHDLYQEWFGKSATHPISIEPYRTDRLRVSLFDIESTEDQSLLEKSFVRRAVLKEKFSNGEPVSSHPIVDAFTTVQEEKTKIMTLIYQVVKVFNVRETPTFTRNDQSGGHVLCKFQVDDNFIMASELKHFESLGYKRYGIFAKKGNLYIQFELRF